MVAAGVLDGPAVGDVQIVEALAEPVQRAGRDGERVVHVATASVAELLFAGDQTPRRAFGPQASQTRSG
jgi:hypothetical protein